MENIFIIISVTNNLKIIFSNWKCLSLAAAISISFWIIFAVLDGLLFFYPSLAFWIPSDAVTNFIISNIIVIMIGIVLSMNVYYFLKHHNKNNLKFNSNIAHNSNKKKQNSIFYASISPLLAILSTGCISCSSSLGLWILTSISSIIGFGTATAFASFISEYQISIKLITLTLLVWSFISINKAIDSNNLECSLVNNKKKNTF